MYGRSGISFRHRIRSSPADRLVWCQRFSTLDSLPSIVMETTKLTGQVAGADVPSFCPPCRSDPRVMPRGRMQCCTMWMMSLRDRGLAV